jgi:hypothetical protein
MVANQGAARGDLSRLQLARSTTNHWSARMAKTGESYQTAERHVRAEAARLPHSPQPGSPPPEPRFEPPTAKAILDQFRVGHMSSIRIRRIMSARSVDYAVDQARVEELAANPTWSAQSETIGKVRYRRLLEFDNDLYWAVEVSTVGMAGRWIPPSRPLGR